MPPDWETLRELAPGKRIIVTTLTTTLAGEFISAESATLVLQRGDAVEHVNADDVLFVVREGAARVGSRRGVRNTGWYLAGIRIGLRPGRDHELLFGLRRGEVGNVGRDCRCSDCRRVWRLAAEQPSDRRGRLPSSLIVAPDHGDPARR